MHAAMGSLLLALLLCSGAVHVSADSYTYTGDYTAETVTAPPGTNSVLEGGGGDDTLTGTGSDYIDGDNGQDTIQLGDSPGGVGEGGNGDDTVRGGSGALGSPLRHRWG